MSRLVVVGGGHAGIEAAWAAARMGVDVRLITIAPETIGLMACNPSIGGLGKGHLVREMDALGALMPLVADESGLQFRTLNLSKGLAVQATRIQNDRRIYQRKIWSRLEQEPRIRICQGLVTELLWEGDRRLRGVVLQSGEEITAQAVILTAGTFLEGLVHVGKRSHAAGRAGEPSAHELGAHLRGRGLEMLRLKTGTPMRIHRDSVDWSKMQPQSGDDPPPFFSFRTEPSEVRNRVVCHLAYTNRRVHEIIHDHLGESALYSGIISGVGPRYCPSVEDKVVKFPQRDRHHLFLEPEGIDRQEVYVGGFSSSLPVPVQERMLHAVEGLERAVMLRAGYAIEYLALNPSRLGMDLQHRDVEGLFCAGQVNGTSGYEEAAAQGLWAGINAARLLKRESSWSLSRQQAYMGVMVDDLVHQGVEEPYRLFTSRAEYRLALREDNAWDRLAPEGRALGLLTDRDWARLEPRLEARKRWVTLLHQKKGEAQGRKGSLWQVLKEPQIHLETLLQNIDAGALPEGGRWDGRLLPGLEADCKYEGYIEQEQRETDRLTRQEKVIIPVDLSYAEVSGLSTEIRQKLERYRPLSLGQARRLPGMTPAAMTALALHLSLKKVRGESAAVETGITGSGRE